MSAERVVSLGAIRYISMSSLRDDWVAFALGSSSEPDIFFSCVFKTELVTRLQIILRGIEIRIGPTYAILKTFLTVVWIGPRNPAN
jgi:myosin I